MEAFRATFSFSSRSGGLSRSAQLHQKAQSRSLHLSRGSLASLAVGRLGIPGGGRDFHHFPHQQELPERQGAQPHPLLGGDGLGRLIGIQAQVLFQNCGIVGFAFSWPMMLVPAIPLFVKVLFFHPQL
jgi:hypothetical protein